MEYLFCFHPKGNKSFFETLKSNGMKAKKSNKANLENRRFMFFEMGMILVLAGVLAAFEWTSVRTNDHDLLMNRDIAIDEEIIDVTVHEKKKPEMPKPQVIKPIEIVDNETEVEEEIEISVEVTKETTNDPDFLLEEEPEEEAEEPKIFISVQEYPSFPGGDLAFLKYIKDNLTYPKDAREIGLTGKVYVRFIVWKDGSIRNVEILRGIGDPCDEAALKVIQNMPRWNPGKQRTEPVNVQMVLPVIFKLN